MKLNGNTGTKPTHRAKVTTATKGNGKSFWTTVGSAWLRPDGSVSVQLNDGLNLILGRGTRLALFPIEETQTEQRVDYDDI